MKVVSTTPFFVLFIIGIIFSLLHLATEHFLINLSPSMPLGVYRIEKLENSLTRKIQRGDIVALCLKPEIQELGLQKKYILPGQTCHKTAPLIKTILAIPRDNILLEMEKITVNDKEHPLKTLKVDSQNHPLGIYPRGDYKNTAGYWVIGSHVANSWDSRYWGPIQRQQILFRLFPILIFEKNYSHSRENL